MNKQRERFTWNSGDVVVVSDSEKEATLNLMAQHVFESQRVEEFFNRVHNTNDGRFGTSGTGGGHFAGRAKGAKRPSLKSGPAPAAKTGKSHRGAVVESSARGSTHGVTHKATTTGKGRAAGSSVESSQRGSNHGVTHTKGTLAKKTSPAPPKRDINAEAKAHVAGLMAKHSADRAARKEANKGKPAAAPKKEEGGDTAKLNDIAKLKQQLKDNPAPANKPAAAGPKPAQAKQDAPSKYERSRALKDPKKVKVPLSERLKKFGKFAKKIGEGVAKDNMSGADWKANKERHNPGSTKGQHLTARSAFLTGRQQRNG